MEYVEVKINVPKQVMDFLKAFTDYAGRSLEEMLTDFILNEIDALIDEDTAFINRTQLIKRHDLDKVLRHYGYKASYDC